MTDMNRDDALAQALRRVKEEDAAMSASPEVEARLLGVVRGFGRQSRRWYTQMAAGVATAVLLFGAGFFTWWMRYRVTPDPAHWGQPAVSQEVVTEFFPLFYGSVPSVNSHLVRMELPRASLARFGIISADAIDRASGTVLADVLVGDDGLARAVRFVRKVS